MLHLITCHGRIMPACGALVMRVMRVMALFQLHFFQNAFVWVRMAPWRGHLCHIDTFLVLFSDQKVINLIAKYNNIDFDFS